MHTIPFSPVCILIFHSDISCNDQQVQEGQGQSTVDLPAISFPEYGKGSTIFLYY